LNAISAGLLDSYLTAQQERADERARGASGESTGERVADEAHKPL
jgi:hypothetical protein